MGDDTLKNIQLKDIQAAREALKNVVETTDTIHNTLEGICNCDLFLKLENLQRTGSFKIRGAFNKIRTLSQEQRNRGVIAASAGNHAQGVAWAASVFGIKSTVIMPETAPLAKITATRNYGASVILHGYVYDDAYQRAVEIQKQTGAEFIHPFDDPDVIVGQGTLGLEILEDTPDIDAIVVPVGGGGLIAGIALGVKALNPRVKIIGVESENVAAMKTSLEQQKLVSLASAATIADGIAVKTPGSLTYSIIKEYVDDMVTVAEDEIAKTILLLLEKYKLVAEGAGAVTMAAVISGRIKMPGKKVAAVISGGNIDVNLLSRIVDKGLAKAGRKTELTTVIPDKPGSLQNMLKVISGLGGNIIEIHHNRISIEAELNWARVDLVLETQDNQHLETLLNELKENNYKVRKT